MKKHVVTEAAPDGSLRSRLETAAWPLAVADALMKAMLPAGLPHPKGNSFDRLVVEVAPACMAVPGDDRLDTQIVLVDKQTAEPVRLIHIQSTDADSEETALSPATLPVYHTTAYFEVREKLAGLVLSISGDHLDVAKILLWVASRDPMHPLWVRLRRRDRDQPGAAVPG